MGKTIELKKRNATWIKQDKNAVNVLSLEDIRITEDMVQKQSHRKEKTEVSCTRYDSQILTKIIDKSMFEVGRSNK